MFLINVYSRTKNWSKNTLVAKTVYCFKPHKSSFNCIFVSNRYIERFLHLLYFCCTWVIHFMLKLYVYVLKQIFRCNITLFLSKIFFILLFSYFLLFNFCFQFHFENRIKKKWGIIIMCTLRVNLSTVWKKTINQLKIAIKYMSFSTIAMQSLLLATTKSFFVFGTYFSLKDFQLHFIAKHNLPYYSTYI